MYQFREQTPPGALRSQKIVKPLTRIRQSKKPLLNQLEGRYLQHLQQHSGCDIFPQAVRLKLGNGVWYKPDFIVITPVHDVLAIEVKGKHAFKGAFEKLKVAAAIYKWIRFKLVWWDEKEGWTSQPVLP